MSNFIDLLKQTPSLVMYVLIAVAVMLAVEAIGLSIARARSYRGRINKRLRLLEATEDHRKALVELRRDRGLTEEGYYAFPVIALNRLTLQSGVALRSGRLFVITGLAFLIGALAAYGFTRSIFVAALVGAATGIVLPILFLMSMRARRHNQFATQLPEALDILVRSLRAGHPIPVAVSLVARDMPDPIGSEFGMTADEMTYGLDLEAALQNMRARVGQHDLSFVVVAVSIQAKTGGNLSEVLTNLSRVIRDRFKLRRRVKAMSAEGRLSAIALSAIPLLVFFMVNLLAPNFYGEIKNDPIVGPVVFATFLLWATGVFTIHRLVNFRY